MCRMWWPLTLTYIFKVIWPWLWKSCLLCNVFSSRSIIFLTWDPIVWVIMRRRGVSSERRRSSCSSLYITQMMPHSYSMFKVPTFVKRALHVCTPVLFNSLCPGLFWRSIKMLIFVSYLLIESWADILNLSLLKTSTCLFCMVSIVAADDVVTQGARASADFIVTLCTWNVPLHAGEG